MNKAIIANYLRYFTRTVLLLLASFWFIFALLSGAEQYGGGFLGVVKNSPNALPWLLLFVFMYIAWKWEQIGGIIVAVFGLVSIFMFDAYEEIGVLFTISIPLIILGGCLITSHYLRK